MTQRAIVVFESMFGNTRLLAETVALGIGEHLPTSVLDAANAPTRLGPEIGLLVVGAPTHAMGLPRSSTREDAVRKFPERARAATDGVREWLTSLECSNRILTATFDSRVHTPVYLGSAARGIARRMHRLGFEVDSVASFYVGGTTGPLDEGEISRARAWGAALAQKAAQLHAVG